MEKNVIKQKQYHINTPENSPEDIFILAFLNYLKASESARENHRKVFEETLEKFLTDSQPVIKEFNVQKEIDNNSYIHILEDAKNRFASENDKVVIQHIIEKAQQNIQTIKSTKSYAGI